MALGALTEETVHTLLPYQLCVFAPLCALQWRHSSLVEHNIH